jgi:membrane protein YqaA with SNARE-associated domain
LFLATILTFADRFRKVQFLNHPPPKEQLMTTPATCDSTPAAPPTGSTDPTNRPGLVKRLYLWVLHWAETPYGTPALFVLSFAESSFFPIPPDVLQIALSVSKPRRSFYYATVSMVASVLGAVLGWYIGFALWEMLGGFFTTYVPGLTQKNFDRVDSLYDQWGFLAVTVAAFTPIPYKVFTISAGMFSYSLPGLVLASIVGRSGRFFTVATCIYFFGPSVKSLIDKYFGLFTFLFAVFLVGGFVLIKFLLH